MSSNKHLATTHNNTEGDNIIQNKIKYVKEYIMHK